MAQRRGRLECQRQRTGRALEELEGCNHKLCNDFQIMGVGIGYITAFSQPPMGHKVRSQAPVDAVAEEVEPAILRLRSSMWPISSHSGVSQNLPGRQPR
jgi:hypothetical protein